MPQYSTRILIEYKPQVLKQYKYVLNDGSQSDSDMDVQIKENEEKQKTDQSQQTTPTTPPNSGKYFIPNRIILGTSCFESVEY
ncbi:hypothetical protein GWI33_014418 [Rhynchophorus ferrugineus]|uniref:Uncharacterized protein n=1 Tax=Rhynchophorus ferrugineus TaxID=354439 RepID=A0A834I1G4_RHYFE|nr:hypothetical protein GWI33_014418 [Rhynchophorus ferrugineus]